jgi:site-specific recombinase
LTRKIVERNAETGEHYIARTAEEYRGMLKSAAGGGAIMAVTTWFKLMILGWHLPGLLQGLAASANYATGFVAIQLSGSTLATKQPANTAPALAHRMHQVREPKAQEELVDEIVFLIRSQFASIVGNLALVVPGTLVLYYLILRATGSPMMSMEKATHTIDSLSLFGPSLFYAGFTGVLLWASSLVAAWADNWFVCHRIGEALTTDRRLVRTLGASRAVRFGRFWSSNIAGLAGNISFGLMLGLIPELAAFAGVPLDIRHVTLSSSMLSAATASLGFSVMTTMPFWLALLGIAAIGFMNVMVSFSLAMFVAIRARGIQSPERRAIYQALLRRLGRQPLSFALPVSGSVKLSGA